MEARRVSMWRGRNMSDDFFPLVRVIYLFVLGASVWEAEGGFFFQYLGNCLIPIWINSRYIEKYLQKFEWRDIVRKSNCSGCV
jgi:hypothetical protein